MIPHFNYKFLKIEVDSLSKRIQDLKFKIFEKEGFEIKKQSLLVNGIQMENDIFLHFYSIKNQSIIILKLISNEELECFDKFGNNFH